MFSPHTCTWTRQRLICTLTLFRSSPAASADWIPVYHASRHSLRKVLKAAHGAIQSGTNGYAPKRLTLPLKWSGTVSNGSRKAPMTNIFLCSITRSRSAAVRCSSLARRLMNADARFIIFSSRQRNISRRWRIAN